VASELRLETIAVDFYFAVKYHKRFPLSFIYERKKRNAIRGYTKSNIIEYDRMEEVQVGIFLNGDKRQRKIYFQVINIDASRIRTCALKEEQISNLSL
jgi:hypothetical protein